MRTEALKRGDV